MAENWPQDEGVFFLSYKLKEEDYENYNLIVMEDVTKKKQKRQTIFGMISTMIVAIILVTFLITGRFQRVFLLLTFLLLLLSLFFVLYFPISFPRKVKKAARQAFVDSENTLAGKSYKFSVGQKGVACQETSADGFIGGEYTISWKQVRRIYIYDVGVVFMKNATEGFFLPSRILERELDGDLKAFIIRKANQNKILVLYER